MNALQSFGSVIGLAVLGFPALVVLGLVLRGTGGLLLSPREGTIVAVTITVAGILRGLLGAFTLDDNFVAPLLMAIPLIVGMRFGAREAVASTAASWWILMVLAMVNDGGGSGVQAASVGPLVVAAGVSVLAGLYAALGARRSRLLAMAPLLLLLAPAFASASEVWADPTFWIGWIACGAWVVFLDARLERLALA